MQIYSRIVLRFLILFTLSLAFEPSLSFGQVTTGLDNLVQDNFKPLAHKLVGLITNQTSRTKDGVFGPDLFRNCTNFKLVALFSPEHGLKGARAAGATSDSIESYFGIPVYSLYGTNRKPSKAMLRGITALVYDMQDIGVRPYTYLSTLLLAMEAAAENNIPFYVLDRPDPLSGERVEGNILDLSLRSFVGEMPTPYIYGMTPGELSRMAVGEKWFNSANKLRLTVIPLRGWKRSMYWHDTGLQWTASSPNIPTPESAVGAAMFGATGELGLISIGIGTDMPFLRIGSNLISTVDLFNIAQPIYSMPVTVVSDDFTTHGTTEKNYHGVRIDLPEDWSKISSLYEQQFILDKQLLHTIELRANFQNLSQSTIQMFEKVTGTPAVYEALQLSSDLKPLFTAWHQDAEKFRQQRARYLLYK